MAAVFKFLISFLLVFSGAVFAQQDCKTYSATNGYGNVPGTGSTPAQAVADWRQKAEALYVSEQCSNGVTGYNRSISTRDITTTTFVVEVTTIYVDWAVNGLNAQGYSTYGCVPRAPIKNVSNGQIGSDLVECSPEDECGKLAGKSAGVSSMDFSVGATSASALANMMGKTMYGCGGSCMLSGEAVGGGLFGGSAMATMSAPTFTGASCDAETPPGSGVAADDLAAPSPCDSGKCPGQVNGATVCVPCDINVTGTKSTSSGSSTTGTNTSTTTSGTTTSVTTCDQTTQKCTTETTTQKNENGSPTSTTTRSEVPLPDFCRANPSHKSCSAEEDKKGSFGGSCQAEFTCEGDAVECATARAVNTQLCNFSATFAVSPEVLSDYALIAAGTKVPHPRQNGTTRNLGTFDQSNPFGSGCPTDQTFVVGDRSFVMPLGSMCGTLQMMGNAMVAFTLLAATLFVLKGAS